jgi:uncharacterized protein YkwD
VSRTRKILSVIALVAAWTVVTASSASAADCGPTGTEVTGLSEPQMESSIACLINQERSSYGLQAVSPNGDLRQAALSHSNEMISEGYFEHTSPAGLTFMDRIESTGYMHSARSWVVGENLVWGTGPRSTPEALVTAWMNSPPHRENLLRPNFSEIGIAAVPGTPESQSDLTGVTVSSEYGYRTFGKTKAKHRAKNKAKAKAGKHKGSKGKARKARAHKKHRHHKH